MEELIKRTEAIDHLQHFGCKDPNLIIYNSYLENGQIEKAQAYLKYREEWESVRRGEKKSKIPLFVTFSLNNFCNLHCAHCYRTLNYDKSLKNMLEVHEIFRLIDECKSLGVPSIGLGTESELLLYRRIGEINDYVSGKEFEDLWIMTNGTLLTDRISDQILDSNATRLAISIDAVTNDTYRKVRGPWFHRLMSNIFNFLDKREQRNKKLPIVRVSFIKYNLTKHEVDDFINFWSKIVDEVDVQLLIDVKNVDLLKYSEMDQGRCDYPNDMLYINWNGDYKPCCSEFCKHLTIGNINSMTIVEAWNSDYMEDLRRQLAGEAPLNKVCINCMRSFHSSEVYEPLE